MSNSWLNEITQETMQNEPVPMKQILDNSLYYPASGTDGTPVKLMSKEIQSFVFVDYAISRTQIQNIIDNEGFRGYKCLGIRDVSELEITPYGFHPTILPSEEELHKLKKTMEYPDLIKDSYAIWTIWDRLPNFGEEHGAKRFSLFAICGDGVACYEAMYYVWETSANAIAIIRPGLGFGWTDFTNTKHILYRVIKSNPYGKPNLLLQESCREPHWPIYSEFEWIEDVTMSVTLERRRICLYKKNNI